MIRRGAPILVIGVLDGRQIQAIHHLAHESRQVALRHPIRQRGGHQPRPELPTNAGATQTVNTTPRGTGRPCPSTSERGLADSQTHLSFPGTPLRDTILQNALLRTAWSVPPSPNGLHEVVPQGLAKSIEAQDRRRHSDRLETLDPLRAPIHIHETQPKRELIQRQT